MTTKIFAFLSLILFLALARFLPHPPNFTPMLALALFAGAKAPNRWLGYIVPVAALWLGDLVIGTHYLMIITGLTLLLATGVGAFTEKSVISFSPAKKVLGWAGAGLISSIIFFLVTNFFVWETSGIYPTTTEGLWNCYVLALPFFHEQILSAWIFSGVAFTAWAVIERSALPLEQERVRGK